MWANITPEIWWNDIQPLPTEEITYRPAKTNDITEWVSLFFNWELTKIVTTKSWKLIVQWWGSIEPVKENISQYQVIV